MKLKHIRLASINYDEKFEDVAGSYYDYVATFYSTSPEKEYAMKNELDQKDWREIKTNNGVIVFTWERHVVRIVRIW